VRHSQFVRVLFFCASISSVSAAGLPKTVDCLQVSVVPRSANPGYAAQPVPPSPGRRPLHMILTNVCSVDITAFMLDVKITSPIPQERHPGMDMLGGLAQSGDQKLPRAGTAFPFDWVIAGEPEDDLRPLELTVRVRGLTFRDGTAAGDASWVAHVEEVRKSEVQDFATELKLLAQIAHLQDAKSILKGDPDASLREPVRAFWLECKRSLSNDPARWAAHIDDSALRARSFAETMSQHPDLTMDSK